MELSEASTEYDEYRINPQCGGTHLVVFGKTGSGKSALCNQLVGDINNLRSDVDLLFPVARSLKVVTQSSKHSYAQQHGHSFTVVDTPGRDSDTDSTQSRLALQQLIESMQRHIIQDNATSPGHVHSSVSNRKTCKAILVFCVRCDVRYARAEQETYLELKELWGDDENFCQRLVVVFTMGDKLAAGSKEKDGTAPERPSKLMAASDMDNTDLQYIDSDFEDDNLKGERIQKEHVTQEDTTGLGDGVRSLNTVPDPKFASVPQTTAQEKMLEEKLKGTGPELQQLIKDAGGRYILFNNKEGHEDGTAVRKLLDMVHKMDVSASLCVSRQEQRAQDEETPRRSSLFCCCRQKQGGRRSGLGKKQKKKLCCCCCCCC